MNTRTLAILEDGGEGCSSLTLTLSAYAALVHTAGTPAGILLQRSSELLEALTAVEYASARAAIEQSAVSVSSISARLLRHPDEAVVDAAAPLITALSGQGQHTTTLACGALELRLVEQPGASCEGHGYGRKIWRASRVASGACTGGGAFDVRGKRVLEVGAGAGAPGVACAAAGAAEVWISDWDVVALQLAARNAALNGVAERVKTAALDWREPEASPLAARPVCCKVPAGRHVPDRPPEPRAPLAVCCPTLLARRLVGTAGAAALRPRGGGRCGLRARARPPRRGGEAAGWKGPLARTWLRTTPLEPALRPPQGGGAAAARGKAPRACTWLRTGPPMPHLSRPQAAPPPPGCHVPPAGAAPLPRARRAQPRGGRARRRPAARCARAREPRTPGAHAIGPGAESSLGRVGVAQPRRRGRASRPSRRPPRRRSSRCAA